MAEKEQTKINVLMNIDSYYGEHQGRLGPFLKFVGVSLIPVVIYLLFLIRFFSFKWLLIFEVPFMIRMALLILGKENEKFAMYMAAKRGEYSNADDLTRIVQVTDDGLIEYEDNSVACIISGFTMTYFDEDELNIDLGKFVPMIRKYNYDIYLHQVVNEYRLQDQVEKMSVYSDRELLRERIDMVVYQDKIMSENTTLYRISFLLKAPRYDWKQLKVDAENACKSTYAKVFKEIHVCNKQECIDVISRDIGVYVELEKMLKKKYGNEEYYGSKVYYYGEEVPEKYQETKETVGLQGRRVIDKGEE